MCVRPLMRALRCAASQARVSPETQRAAESPLPTRNFHSRSPCESDAARARLTGLVAIRRVDGTGDDVAGRVARAEQALAANDFAAAITEIGALEGAAATRASDWLADARRRQAALDVVRALQARMVAHSTRER